jgi:uncharacterized protein YcbK (DUF882 family)
MYVYEMMYPFFENASQIYKVTCNRRNILKCGILAGIASVLPVPVDAASRLLYPREKSLCLYNLHTDETLDIVYWRQGKYLPKALTKINYFLRDYRTDEVTSINKQLLDLLYSLHKRLKVDHPFTVISGYRSPATNSYLRKCSRGVAKNSLHMYGKAIDINLPECKLSSLRRAAVNLHAGGVGYYPASDFIHVDVGRVRFW